MAGPTDGGVTVTTTPKGGGKVSLSDKSFETFVNGVVDMWQRWLDWAERNPILFVIVLILFLIGFIVWIRHRTRIKTMTYEYDGARERAKVQMPLPLPSPPPKKRTGKG